MFVFFFSSRRRHTRCSRDWSSDVCSSDLWCGTFDGQPRLAQAPLDGGPTAQVKLPPLTQDAVGYIAQNPVARSEYAIATFGRSVYLSKDAGRTWTAIAERGQSK